MKYSSNRLNTTTLGSSSSMYFQLQQIATILLMVIGLCATSIIGSPTRQPQQTQQKEQIQRQPEHQNHQTTTIRAQQCRDGCLEKFSNTNPLCQTSPKCSACLGECSHRNQVKGTSSIRETWSLRTVSMVQHDTLVLVDVAWDNSNVPYQCLVTWEVSGGGLMGNLLTESFGVQLSLWPDTKYRVQVTCKNKRSGQMSRSLPLSINTSEAIKVIDSPADMPTSIFTNVPISTLPSTTSNPLTEPKTSFSDINDADIDTNVVPFDDHDQSEDTNDQHENSLFIWNPARKNDDIAFIEPIRNAELDILTTLRKAHRPLIYAMIAVIVLLTLIIVLCAYAIRNQRLSGDKAMLLAEDFNINGFTSPATEKKSPKTPTFLPQSSDGSCKFQATCSRHTPRV